jgi:hypothetical protein
LCLRYKKVDGVRWLTPKEPSRFIPAAGLNGGDASDFYIKKDRKGRVILGRNFSDTCVTGSLVLFANTGYQNGYVETNDECTSSDHAKTYAKVTCTVQ